MVNSNQHLYNSKTFSQFPFGYEFFALVFNLNPSLRIIKKVYAKKVTSRVRDFKGYFHVSCKKGHSQIKLWQKNHAIVNFLEHSQLKILHWNPSVVDILVMAKLSTIEGFLFVFIWRKKWSSQHCLLLRGSSVYHFSKKIQSL